MGENLLYIKNRKNVQLAKSSGLKMTFLLNVRKKLVKKEEEKPKKKKRGEKRRKKKRKGKKFVLNLGYLEKF